MTIAEPVAHRTWQPGLSAKLAVAGFAALLALLACELVARVTFPPPPDASRQPQIGYAYDAEILHVPRPSQQAWIDEGLVTLNTQGYRGGEVAIPKPRGRLRVVTIGDSLTLGWGVHDAETYSTQLERLLRQSTSHTRDVDVVNLGVSGYNTRQAVTWLSRHVERLEPDLVVLGFYSNDVPDALEDEGAGTRRAVQPADKDRVLRINPTPTDWWSRQLRRSRAIYVAGRAFNRYRGAGEWGMSRFAMEIDMLEGRQSADLERAWGVVHAQFDRLRALSVEHGFRVAIVVLPSREQVMGQYAHASFQRYVRALATPLGFEIIDPLAVMIAHRKDPNDLFIAYDRNHPSAQGHALIAEAIAAQVATRGLLGDAR